MNGLIIEHTGLVAEGLRQQFALDPEGELEAWTSVAQQREAMVVAVYGAGTLDSRLPSRAEPEELVHVVRKAIGGIWAQEASHKALIGALRQVDTIQNSQLQGWMGTVEGKITDFATRQGLLNPIARFLISFGRAAHLAPAFTAQLGVMNLREFCQFSHELEITAAQGYQRIIELIDELDSRPEGPSFKYGISQRYEFAKTLAEERFHTAVFKKLQEWLTADGATFQKRAAKDAVLELHTVANSILRLPNIMELPRSIRGEAPQPGFEELVPWISDGGLGALFEDFEMQPPIARAPSTERASA